MVSANWWNAGKFLAVYRTCDGLINVEYNNRIIITFGMVAWK